MSTLVALRAIAEFAENQYGFCTAAQATGAGVSSSALTRMAAHDVLEKVAHGLYRVRGGGHHPHSGLYAHWLMLAPAIPAWERDETAGVVSHESAAYCYEIGELNAFHYEFTLTGRRQSTDPDVKLHRRADLGVKGVDWEELHGMTVTRPHRVVEDLLDGPYDFHDVGTVAADALRRGMATRDQLTNAIARTATFHKHGAEIGNPEQFLDWLMSDVASYFPEALAS